MVALITFIVSYIILRIVTIFMGEEIMFIFITLGLSLIIAVAVSLPYYYSKIMRALKEIYDGEQDNKDEDQNKFA